MYSSKTRRVFIKLCALVLFFSAARPLHAMDQHQHIINLTESSLSAQDSAHVQEIAAIWQDFYKHHSYQDLIAQSMPFVDVCGIIYELRGAHLPRQDRESTCVVDMTTVKGATGPHFHRKTIEIYFVLQGSGTIVIGSREYQVKTGDIIYIPTMVGHYTVPLQDLIIGVVNEPKFDPTDLIELRSADDATRKDVQYDDARYMHYKNQ